MVGKRPHDSKARLLDAALFVIRAQGYAGTTIDDICHRAGVTKGSFFHHFKSKEQLALSAVNHFATATDEMFAAAAFHELSDPLERVFGYVDLRAEMLTGDLADYTCLLGTMVQETYATHPEIRAACNEALSSHVASLTTDLEAARKRYVPRAAWSAESVGLFIQTVLQGSFIFAKSRDSPKVARENLDHLRRYLTCLFQPSETANREKP